jgi:transcription antitermination factor NusA-like protein
MKKEILRLIFITVGLVLVILFLKPYVIEQSKIDELYKELHKKTDSLYIENEKLERELYISKAKSDSIGKQIGKQTDRIIYLKQQQNEKIKIISNYSNNELYIFLSNIHITPDSIAPRW